jgi:phosphatidylserine/phosphatidylglycerophosphate/cardiolipin synthase-like enzyme
MTRRVLLSPASDPKGIEVPSAPAPGPAQDLRIAGYPPTKGRVTPLVDGQAAYQAMLDDITSAKKSLYFTAWYLQLQTVLKSGTKSMTVSQVVADAVKRGVQVCVLVNYLESAKVTLPGGATVNLGFPNALSAASVCKTLEGLGAKALVARHPETLPWLGKTYVVGTHHEKYLLVDGKIAFCGGLEFAEAYTESNPSHQKSNRHDVHLKLEGPIVADLEEHFRRRWQLEDPRRSILASGGTPDSRADTHAVQLAFTHPRPSGVEGLYGPIEEVREHYIKAIGEAKTFIYIENQYFRHRALCDALVEAMTREPELQVILLLPVAPEEVRDALTLHATYLERTLIEALLAVPGKRVGVYSLKRDNGSEIYVHSKVMIVDDLWFTVGSANTDPRSFWLDSEANVVVRDDQLASSLRTTLWTEHLQPTADELPQLAMRNAAGFVKLWNRRAKEDEDALTQKKKPPGRVVVHVPEQGKKFDPSTLGINGLMKLAIPDLDKYTQVIEKDAKKASARSGTPPPRPHVPLARVARPSSGQEPTLKEARSKNISLPEKPLDLMLSQWFWVEMQGVDRRPWYTAQLGPYQNQLRETSAETGVPLQLLAAIILNELADINGVDVVQSELDVTQGSLGMAQIEIDTVLDHELFPDLSDEEVNKVLRDYQNERDSEPLFGEPTQADFHDWLKDIGFGRRLAVSHRLQVPQQCIAACGRELRILLDRLSEGRGNPWASQFGYRWAGGRSANPQQIYKYIDDRQTVQPTPPPANDITRWELDAERAKEAGIPPPPRPTTPLGSIPVKKGRMREPEANMARLVAAAYNSPDIIIARNVSGNRYLNGRIHGLNCGRIAQEIFDASLFRP